MSMNKESILVRRNGLLGLGNAGWEDFPTRVQLNSATVKIFDKFGHFSEKWVIIDEGYRDSEEFSESTKIRYASLPLPWTPDHNTWNTIKIALSRQAGHELNEEVDALLSGNLQPVLVYEDYGVIDGENQLLIANALAIPVRTFMLKRVRKEIL